MDIDTILDHFAYVDPIMAHAGQRVKKTLKPLIKTSHDTYLYDLCESIVSQQLSVKAAATIWSRTHAIISDWNDANCILIASPEDLRNAGLSYQKISYVRNIAQAVFDQSLHIHRFNDMSDEEVCAELIKIKGIGQWTAEMFLIFTLARTDVFSAGDLGLRNAIKKLYLLDTVTPAEALERSQTWAPYRSTACRILWKTLDNEP